LRDKAIWSQTEPKNDLTAGFAPYVFFPSLPAIIDALFLSAVQTLSGFGTNLTTLAPNVPRNDLVAVFFNGVPGITDLGPTSTTVEYIRLNTSVNPTPLDTQINLGVIGGDTAGYPNGRRPGDDVVDISLRVVMGVLCTINLNCTPADAPVGAFPFTDGAPQNAGQFQSGFPWLNTPNPGATTVDGSFCSESDSSSNSNGGSDSSSTTGTGGTSSGSVTGTGDGTDGDDAARIQAIISANIHNLRKVILGH